MSIKEQHKAMGDVLTAAHVVNVVGPTNVFVEFSGHVNWIAVRVHRNGWEDKEPNCSWDWQRTVYLDQDKALEQLCALRRDILAELIGVNLVVSERDKVGGFKTPEEDAKEALL